MFLLKRLTCRFLSPIAGDVLLVLEPQQPIIKANIPVSEQFTMNTLRMTRQPPAVQCVGNR
jgi:hypothetical protein